MIKGLGVDIVKINRISRIADRWQDKFLNKVFTTSEINYCSQKKDKNQHLAARFAAKEAVVKMLGTGFKKIGFKEIEVINDDHGKPEVILYDRTQKIASEKGIETIHISLSHEKEYAIAEVIGEGN